MKSMRLVVPAAVGRPFTWLAAMSLGACSLADPEFEDEPRSASAAGETQVASVVCEFEPAEVTSIPIMARNPPTTDVSPLSSQPSSPCPERMVEVKGSFCTSVMHRCSKGGRTHLGEDTQEPVPFYCDKYQAGYAKCLGKEEPKHFCIDEYEYPNQQGIIPTVMVSWHEARKLCEAQGKRLCRDDEWTLACEGPERLPYPYGWERDRSACNIDHQWMRPNDELLLSDASEPAARQAEVDRLSKRVASGSMPECKSPYGVMDMVGNVDEWAVNATLNGKPYQSVFKGGHWVSGARNRCRPVTTSHDETTEYYAEGFRCCANAADATAR